MTGKRSFGGIDVGKLCLAAIVAAVHTLTIESGVPLLNRAWTELQAYPVPFFFLAAGFFLGRRLQQPFSARENRAVLTGYLRRMVRMYALWSLVYFPFAFPGYLQSAGSAGKAFLDYACDALFFGSYGPFPVLWYLLAAVYAALLLLLLHALRSPDGGVLCAGLAFIVIYRFIQSHIWMSGVQAPELRFLQHAYLATFRSGRVFLGCVYVPIGVFLSRRMPPRPAAAAVQSAHRWAAPRRPAARPGQSATKAAQAPDETGSAAAPRLPQTGSGESCAANRGHRRAARSLQAELSAQDALHLLHGARGAPAHQPHSRAYGIADGG